MKRVLVLMTVAFVLSMFSCKSSKTASSTPSSTTSPTTTDTSGKMNTDSTHHR